MKYLFIITCIFLCNPLVSQKLTSQELLEKSINYHDPTGNWEKFDGKLLIVSTTPNRPERTREVYLNNKKGHFTMHSSGEKSVFYSVSPFEVNVELDGSSEISESDEKKYRANIKGAKMYRDYITYLYGLPMKLNDPGTIIHDELKETIFYDLPSIRLKVTYEKDVGEDTWYFYFDRDTYALRAYQFFHDESKNDGEYILLSEERIIENIRIPAIRKWYYNKDNKYLGTDSLKESNE